MFKKLVGLVAFLSIVACGGGAPSEMAQFEPGLVGVYKLVEVRGPFPTYNTGNTLGTLTLDDNNIFTQGFSNILREDGIIPLEYDLGGEWHATLLNIDFNDLVMEWNTTKADGIGTGPGETLTVYDPANDIAFDWQWVTTPPRN